MFDWLDSVPGYASDWSDPRVKVLSAVEEGEGV